MPHKIYKLLPHFVVSHTRAQDEEVKVKEQRTRGGKDGMRARKGNKERMWLRWGQKVNNTVKHERIVVRACTREKTSRETPREKKKQAMGKADPENGRHPRPLETRAIVSL